MNMNMLRWFNIFLLFLFDMICWGLIVNAVIFFLIEKYWSDIYIPIGLVVTLLVAGAITGIVSTIILDVLRKRIK